MIQDHRDLPAHLDHVVTLDPVAKMETQARMAILATGENQGPKANKAAQVKLDPVDQLGLRDLRVHKESVANPEILEKMAHLDQVVLKAQEAMMVGKDPLVQLVQKALAVSLVKMETPEILDLAVTQDLMEVMVRQETQETQASAERPDRRDPRAVMVILALKGQTAHVVTLAPEEKLDLKDLPADLGLMEPPETQDQLDPWAQLEVAVNQDLLVPLERVATLDHVVILVLRATLAVTASQVRQDLLEHLETQDRKVLRAAQVNLAQMDHRDHQATRDHEEKTVILEGLAQMESPGPMETPDVMVNLVRLDPRVTQARLVPQVPVAHKEAVVKLAQTENPGDRVLMATQDQRVREASLDQMALQDLKVTGDSLDQMVILDQEETLDPRDQRDLLEHAESLDQRDRKVRLDRGDPLDPRAQREMQAHRASQVAMVLLETPALPDLKEDEVNQGLMVTRELAASPDPEVTLDLLAKMAGLVSRAKLAMPGNLGQLALQEILVSVAPLVPGESLDQMETVDLLAPPEPPAALEGLARGEMKVQKAQRVHVVSQENKDRQDHPDPKDPEEIEEKTDAMENQDPRGRLVQRAAGESLAATGLQDQVVQLAKPDRRVKRDPKDQQVLVENLAPRETPGLMERLATLATPDLKAQLAQ